MNEELQLTRLTIADLNNVIALQEKNINNFKEEEKHFTVHRTKQDFITALTADNQFMYGIYIGKTLVAQSILEFPKDGEQSYVKGGAEGYKNSEIAIYKAVLVDPDYRGRGLMMRMLQAREDMAVMCGKKIAICKVSADNTFSWTNVLKHGMEIVNVFDEGGHKKMCLQKELNVASRVQPEYKNKIMMDFNINNNILVNKMARICEMGKIGIWDKENKSLAWVDNSKVMANMNNNQFMKENLLGLTLAR